VPETLLLHLQWAMEHTSSTIAPALALAGHHHVYVHNVHVLNVRQLHNAEANTCSACSLNSDGTAELPAAAIKHSQRRPA
jgi:hypothetical protein